MLLWFTKNWLVALAGVALLCALTFAAVSVFDKKQKRAEATLVNSGAAIERGAANNKVIADVEEARKPVTAAERISVCSKYDRNCDPNSQ